MKHLGIVFAAMMALSCAVNVCDPSFACDSDLDCLAPVERMTQPYRCIQGRCASVGCLTDLDCETGRVCVSTDCQPIVLKAIGDTCNVTIGERCEGEAQCDLRTMRCVAPVSALEDACALDRYPPCSQPRVCLPLTASRFVCSDASETARDLGESCARPSEAVSPSALCAPGLICVDGICSVMKAPRLGKMNCTAFCLSNDDCLTKACVHGVCSYSAAPRGTACSVNEECLSRKCTNEVCEGDDCDTTQCGEDEVCLHDEDGARCFADPFRCGSDQVWKLGRCQALGKSGDRCDINEDCTKGLYCQQEGKKCVASATLGNSCAWERTEDGILQDNCNTEANEGCACVKGQPLCVNVTEVHTKAKAKVAGDVHVGSGCATVLADPKALFCIDQLPFGDSFHTPLLSFALSNRSDAVAKECQASWAQYMCCSVCRDVEAEIIGGADSTDLLTRGTPGLLCSLPTPSLTPVLGSIDGECTIGPILAPHTRKWWKEEFCGDFLRDFDPKKAGPLSNDALSIVSLPVDLILVALMILFSR